MNKEEKGAIDRIQKRIKDNEDYSTNHVWLTEDVRCARVVLNLIQKQDKIIDEMAIELYNYANLGKLNICPAEQDNGNYNLELCKMNLADRNCCKCIKEYFKKEIDKGEQS